MLPGALPFIVTGLRLAVGRGLIGMVLADLYTAISGIGYLIVRTASTYQVDKMFVPIVTLGVLGVTLPRCCGCSRSRSRRGRRRGGGIRRSAGLASSAAETHRDLRSVAMRFANGHPSLRALRMR